MHVQFVAPGPNTATKSTRLKSEFSLAVPLTRTAMRRSWETQLHQSINRLGPLFQVLEWKIARGAPKLPSIHASPNVSPWLKSLKSLLKGSSQYEPIVLQADWSQ